jgi:hypothetical protein
MAKRTHKPGEIVARLRQVDVLHGQGMTMAEAIRRVGAIEQCGRHYTTVRPHEAIGNQVPMDLLCSDPNPIDCTKCGRDLR